MDVRRRAGAIEVASIVAWAFVFVVLQALPAIAHDPDDFWSGYEWASQDRNTTKQYYEFTEQVPGDSNGAFADRVAEGGQKWNAIDIAGADNRFVRNGVVSNYDPYRSCGDIEGTSDEYKNGIHYRQTNGNAAAQIKVCWDARVGTDRIFSFQIIFDPDVNWYKSDSYSGIGSGERDVEATSAHEFGHGVGGWTTSSLYHFESPRDGTICSASYTSRHTMCSGAVWPNGSTNPYRRTLESHDIHTYVDRYA